MHFLKFVLSVILLDSITLAQSGNEGVIRQSVEKLLVNQEALRKEKETYVASIDPLKRYTLDQHQLLWNKQIELSVSRQIGPKFYTGGEATAPQFRVDKFGLSTTGLINDRHPQLANKLMSSIGAELEKTTVGFDKVFGLVQEIKNQVDLVWKKSHDPKFESLIVRAGLGAKFSTISTKEEIWLCVEVSHMEPNSHDLFIHDLIQRQQQQLASFGQADRESAQVYSLQHPMVAERRTMGLRKLERDRNQVGVVVHDDKLTIAERESLYDFRLIDNTKNKFHQIESCTWGNPESNREGRALGEVGSLVNSRIPPGSYLSYEELHLRIGSVANVFRRQFPNYGLVFNIDEHKNGNFTYSRLSVSLVQH